MELEKQVIGRKIVFVHPPELVSKHMLDFLTEKEYEVYTLQDHTKVKWINTIYPGTIFFLNIDTALKEVEWEQFILDLRREHPEIQLGVMSFKITDSEIIQHYVMDLGINCGFMQMKQGVKPAADMMLKILQVNEAKGKRKYVRYKCVDQQVHLNFKLGGDQVSGSIMDISSIGMSFTLDESLELARNQRIKDIQLQLKGILVNTHGVLLGQRAMEDETLYVVLFNSPDLQKVRERVHSYIHTAMQKEFDGKFR